MRRVQRTNHAAPDARPRATFTARSLGPQFGRLAHVGRLGPVVGRVAQLWPLCGFRGQSWQAAGSEVLPLSKHLRGTRPGLVDGRRGRHTRESRPRRHVNTPFRLARRDHHRAERLRACTVLIDCHGRRARSAGRAIAPTAARLVVEEDKMPHRPTVRTLLIAGARNARQESRLVWKRADHALIAARSRSHAGEP